MVRQIVRLKKPAAIILDIDGTITSARFYSEVLIPFFREHFEACLRDTWDQARTIDCVALLRNKWAYECTNGNDTGMPPIADESAPRNEIIKSLARNAFDLMFRRPSRELLSAQILTWLYGYQKGLLKGHIYFDVQPALQRWTQQNIRVFTFSYGSVISQRLLFGCSTSGNVNSYFENYFNEESAGHKTDPESYRNIAKAIKTNPNNIVFCSDDILELRAAQVAGIVPIMVVRSHNRNRVEGCPFKCILTFRDLEFL